MPQTTRLLLAALSIGLLAISASAAQSERRGGGQGRSGQQQKRGQTEQTVKPSNPEDLLAQFDGKVVGASKKSITIVDEDGNETPFDSTNKTRYFEGTKQVTAGDVKAGQQVVVEARHTLDGRLEAVNVRLQRPPK